MRITQPSELTELKLTCWRRENGDAMAEVSWKTADYDLPYNWEQPNGGRPPGLHRCGFILEWAEFELICSGRGYSRTIDDGYHKLQLLGETWLFFDMENLPNVAAGELQGIRFRQIEMPRLGGEKLLAIGRELLATATPDGDRKQESVLDRYREWCADFGQATGTVKYDCTPDCADRLGALRGEPTFDRCIDGIERIALNTTWAKTDIAVIRIYIESPCAFIWTAGRLTGGLINHGSEESPDWSTHT